MEELKMKGEDYKQEAEKSEDTGGEYDRYKINE